MTTAQHTEVEVVAAAAEPSARRTPHERLLGAGARPEIGARAAEESLHDIRARLEGAHMVFIAAGMARAVLGLLIPAESAIHHGRIGRFLLLPLMGALIATAFDWIMEPAAVGLGFWTWAGDGSIPMLNYACWFLISWLLLLAGMLFGIEVRNRFSIPLLLIQSLFFLMLRWLA